MLAIEINGKSVSHNFTNTQNVYELLPLIKKSFLSEREIIIELAINNEPVYIKNKDMLCNLGIDNVRGISLRTSTNYDVILEVIQTMPKYINNINEKVMLTVMLYNKQQYSLGDLILEDIIENLDVFIQLISHIHQGLVVGCDSRLENKTTVKNLEIHLLSVLKAIIRAKQVSDYIMLTDLLEYELRANLTQWKISAIPHIKSLNNN